MKKIALLGLGTMGSGMGQNLLKAGFDLTVYNRTPSKADPLRSKGARNLVGRKRRSAGIKAGQCVHRVRNSDARVDRGAFLCRNRT